MAIITPARLIALKKAIKDECQRRCHTGSVANYGASTYDFEYTPTSKNIIKKEHYEKNAIPLNAIVDNLDTNGARIISETEIANMESLVTKLKGISIYSSNPNCASSCTGLCTTSCATTCSGSCDDDCNGCTGCSGCGGCDNTCSGSCDGSCKGDCQGNCLYTCSGSCIEVCSESCNGTCSGGCDTSCDWTTSSIHSK